MLKKIQIPNGVEVNNLGQGTWHMGQDQSQHNREVDALCYGMDLGINLIDTAEMYHDAELVVADAIKGRRDEAFIVSKVLPGNASKKGTIKACEKSLKRMGIDCMDMYLLHWMGSHPLSETLEAFLLLVDQGKIKHFGVSNLDITEMEDIWSLPGGYGMATNQVLYNLSQRAIEWRLLPWCRKRKIPIMAYSPLNQGKINSDVLDQIGSKHGANRFQIALAWVLMQSDVIAIPKSSSRDHIDQNLDALNIQLDADDLQAIDTTFPPPKSPVALNMY